MLLNKFIIYLLLFLNNFYYSFNLNDDYLTNNYFYIIVFFINYLFIQSIVNTIGYNCYLNII